MPMINPVPSLAEELWLPTGQACRVLNYSATTLKRYASRDGFLLEGQHWRRGPHRQSPMVWNVTACHDAITRHEQLKQHRQNQFRPLVS